MESTITAMIFEVNTWFKGTMSLRSSNVFAGLLFQVLFSLLSLDFLTVLLLWLTIKETIIHILA